MTLPATTMPLSLLWGAAALNGIACAFSVRSTIAAMRDRRTASRMRVLTFAYEKQLEAMGAKLPVRCVLCCQVLPEHVGGCIMEDHYKEFGFVFECLTRPPIKYLSKNKKAS